ncbi:MAG TPA: hypothetical protein VFT16_00735 [Candidatus Saccharimonadales bacterium]|nr:hypothetical protein [Candidatus Saccharimonadales bacterium]
MKFEANYRSVHPGTIRPINNIPPLPQPKQQRAASEPPKPGFWQKAQLPLIVFGGTIAGFFIQTIAFGMIVIAVYGVYALAAKTPSRTTFMLATFSVGTVTCLLLVKPNPELAANFSTYTFLLLVIGVIALLREGRPLKRRKRSRTRRHRL